MSVPGLYRQYSVHCNLSSYCIPYSTLLLYRLIFKYKLFKIITPSNFILFYFFIFGVTDNSGSSIGIVARLRTGQTRNRSVLTAEAKLFFSMNIICIGLILQMRDNCVLMPR
jgi:hypothetical protein